MCQLDPTRNQIDPNLFLTRLKWPVLTCDPFDPQPDWPNPNPTRPARFVMSGTLGPAKEWSAAKIIHEAQIWIGHKILLAKEHSNNMLSLLSI